ncbi:MAG: hypothetical protein WA981_08795 [Glaciecola sp.]
MLKPLFLLLLTYSSFAQSSNDVLSIDRVVPKSANLAFPNTSNIQPEQSDFTVDNFVLMSNEKGERWAVVTLVNLASGSRTLTHRQLMALLANGDRVQPIEFSHSFKANEILSLTIYFGESKFPLLSVYSRTDKQPNK